jgi:hypothetical protein
VFHRCVLANRGRNWGNRISQAGRLTRLEQRISAHEVIATVDVNLLSGCGGQHPGE